MTGGPPREAEADSGQRRRNRLTKSRRLAKVGTLSPPLATCPRTPRRERFAMPASLALLPLILALGGLGLCVWPEEAASAPPSPARAFRLILAGLATLSLLMMLLAILGIFSRPALAASAILVAWAAARGKGGAAAREYYRRHALRYLLYFLALAALALTVNLLARPLEARLHSLDASVYRGAASQLAASGALGGVDPLAAEMSAAEREVLFKNRFASDSSGQFIRFPGGIPFTDLEQGRVSFYFYHLWPVWLAGGELFLGAPASLTLLSLFAALALAALLLLGKQLADWRFGLSLLPVLFFSFPQNYYSRLPLSEIPAQALFLAGLLTFSQARLATGKQRFHLQLLAGALWGTLALCRAEGVIFLPAALALLFLLRKDSGREIVAWLPLLATFFAYLLLAALHQLASASYLPLLPPATFAGREGLASFVPRHERELLLALGVVLFLAHRGYRRWTPAGRALLAGTIKLCLALLLGVWLVLFGREIAPGELLRHLQWLHLYLPAWLLLLGAFALAATARQLRPGQKATDALPGIILLFLLVPLCGLLLKPMVTPSQPWAIRRFVPMVLPLFLLLTLFFCYRPRPQGGRLWQRLHLPLYTILTLGLSAWFFAQSAWLNQPPFPTALEPQLTRLARRIPEQSLVLIPNGEAGMHLQTALQYGFQRTALLLPPASELDPEEKRVLRDYLQRQLAAGRPILSLFFTPSFLPRLLAEPFELQELFAEELALAELPQSAGDEFPGGAHLAQLLYRGFQLHPPGEVPFPRRIDIGQPGSDLPWLLSGFHPPEGNPADPASLYRWSMAESELLLPPVRRIKILFHPWRPATAPPLDLAVLVAGAPVDFQQRLEHGQGVIEIELPSSPRPVRLTLRSTPFVMSTLAISADSRPLGLALYRLELQE